MSICHFRKRISAGLAFLLLVTLLFGVTVFAASNETVSNQSVLATITVNSSVTTSPVQEQVTVSSTPGNETAVPTTLQTPMVTPATITTTSPAITQTIAPVATLVNVTTVPTTITPTTATTASPTITPNVTATPTPTQTITPTSANQTSSSIQYTGKHPLMHLTKDQWARMQSDFAASPRYAAPQWAHFAAGSVPTGGSVSSGSPTGSYPSMVSLLSYLPYIPSQRNQVTCGNCWVWASTGALEIDHNVNYGTSDRLSIQYFDSKYQNETGNYACAGGWLSTFVSWYNSDKSPIPWTNTNALFGDADAGSGGTLVPFSTISTSPAYTLNSLKYTTINTYGVSNATAITNIEGALNANKAVEYSFFMNYAGWNAFDSYWSYGSSTSLFDPSIYNSESDAGHAVIIVGYNTTDPAGPYWLVVNSWGAPSNRPDGTFRLNMSLNYDASIGGEGEQSYFQFVNSTFPTKNVAPTVTSVSPNSGPSTGGTSVTITGIGFTGETGVMFGSTPVTSVTAANAASADSQIIATAPAGSVGTVDVTITTPIGTSAKSSADQYTYTTPPYTTPQAVTSTVGIFRNGVFYLRNSNTGGPADIVFGYGNPTDIPVVGDWTGQGMDTVGVYRNGVFYLRNSNTGGPADTVFGYGSPGDIPVIGDWTGQINSTTGQPVDTVGVYRNGVFYLRNSNTGGPADTVFGYGSPGDIPVNGRWI
ncbi:MAG: C1 family peptidase [Methanoregula sp.]